MSGKTDFKKAAGSRKMKNEPRLVGDIVKDMLLSNSKLARGYRQYIVSQENWEADGQGWKCNTDPCMDVKTFLRTDRVTQLGKDYPGMLTRDGEDHYTFVESTFPSTSERRNVHLYEGDHITCTKRLNGSLRLNFKNLKMGADFSVDSYAIEVANEIREALIGLV